MKTIKILLVLLLLQLSQHTLYCQTPFCSINRSYLEKLGLNHIVINGNTYYFEDYFSKDVSKLIDSLGNPDYQAGWLDYLDAIHHSELSLLFPSDYYNIQIPIKAYIWKENGADLLCICSYDDFRMQHFPMTYSDYFQPYLGVKWLSLHSGDDGFRVLLWKHIDSPDSLSMILSPFCDSEIVDYPDENTVDIYDYYTNNCIIKRLKMNRFKLWKPLHAVIGRKRSNIMWHCGKPSHIRYVQKSSITEENFSDYWLIYNRLPDFFQIDEYCKLGYCQKMYYWNGRLQFVSFSSDSLIIQ